MKDCYIMSPCVSLLYTAKIGGAIILTHDVMFISNIRHIVDIYGAPFVKKSNFYPI